MEVEDTPHRVYIHDLAAELSDIESDEENPIFLADIEKHLSKIPQHILRGPEPKSTEHNQMVLYNVPTSLTVPEEQDNVRKAIVEARQRIRKQQASPLTEPERTGISSSGAPLSMAVEPPPPAPLQNEDDAMDID
jgi:anthranilate phosphoribosyltransferase